MPINRERLILRGLLRISIYLLLGYLLYLKINQEQENQESDEVENVISYGDEFSVNTSGCQIHSMKPFVDSAISFMVPFGPFFCPELQLMRAETIEGRNYMVRSLSDSGYFRTLLLKGRHLFCMYREFIRDDDFCNTYISLKFLRLKNDFKRVEVGSGEQNIRIWCWVDFGRLIFHDVLFFVPPPKPESESPPVHSKLSVMIMGVDSISHMHYLRYLHQVADFIERLPHTEFWGYNRVGHNTYPNLVPLLSGNTSDDLEDKCYRYYTNYDHCHFLWDDFKAAGYETVFAEDTDMYALFVYLKGGFKKQPTDYYFRSLLREAEVNSLYRTELDFRCTGGRLYEQQYYEFIYKLLPHMRQRPFFSFLWKMQGIHDHFNFARLVDSDFLNMFRKIQEQGIMDHTLILFMSDHGIRFEGFAKTYLGQREMSQPLLIAIYPEWMVQRYPLAMKNLKNNARSLITTFDLHETLKDILHLDLITDENIKNRTQHLPETQKGISLFLPIPDLRNCNIAGIPRHYCLCEELTSIPIEKMSVQLAARFAVAKINELIQPYPQCKQLRLKDVTDAYGVTKDDILQILVRFRTKPGDGCFDATILEKNLKLSGGRNLTLGGPVTRTDRYDHQSFCVKNFQIEMYCYCL